MPFLKNVFTTNFANELRAFAYEIQNLEATSFEVYEKRLLEEAEGAQLDVIGEIVGGGDCPRAGLDDTNYRIRILDQIAMNQSCGEAERLIKALKVLTLVNTQELKEYFPASIVMSFPETDGDEPTEIASRMNKVRAAGVNLAVIRYDPTQAFMTASGDSVETSATHGLANDGQTTGGKLSEILT